MKKQYKPLKMFTKQTDELKRLIEQHPDYQIVVICSSDVVCDDGGWWYAPSLSYSIGEILDCEQDIDDDKTYVDRDDFKEDVIFFVESNDELFDSLTDEEFDKEVKRIIAEYDPYWKNVIVIKCDI